MQYNISTYEPDAKAVASLRGQRDNGDENRSRGACQALDPPERPRDTFCPRRTRSTSAIRRSWAACLWRCVGGVGELLFSASQTKYGAMRLDLMGPRAVPNHVARDNTMSHCYLRGEFPRMVAGSLACMLLTVAPKRRREAGMTGRLQRLCQTKE